MSEALPYFVSSEDEVELPWSRSGVPSRRRAAPDGLVLFDRLLHLAQIDPVLYPPEDHLSLRRLLSAIDDSQTFDTLKKNCLVYYLLKEFADGREAQYAHKRRIPKRFVTSTEAYWLLDHEQYASGCKKLCAPAVVPDFLPSILQMLDASDDKSESAELIVNIVTYKYPDPQEMDQVKIILAAFLRLGRVTEALELSRRMALAGVQEDGDMEAEALEQAGRRISDIMSFIFDTCFTSVPPLSKALDKLLYMPLSQEEDTAMMSWLSEALASSSKLPDSNISLLTEWATGRLMAQGRFVDAITLLSQSSTSLRRSARDQKRVQDILADLFSVLPPIQRSLVDVTLASSTDVQKQPQASTSTASASITQMPWAGGLSVPNLPVPRSLAQAKANKAFIDEMKAGGKPLNREQDLPLSAGGLLRPSGQSNIGLSRTQAKHDERMDVWNAVKKSDSPTKLRHAPTSVYSSAIPASPVRSGTPGRMTGSPFASLATGQSSRKPTVQGFGLHRPANAAARQPATQLDFSEAMRKYQKRQNPGNEESAESSNRREEPKAYDLPAKTPKKHLPPGAFPSSASVAGTTNTMTDDEDDHHSEAGMSDISEIPIPGSVRRNYGLPADVSVADFAAPPARSTRSRRQSSVAPQASEATTSAPTTGRKTRQRTTSTRDMPAPTPAKKGKTDSSSSTKGSALPRRSRRLGSVAPSEPDLQMMEMPDADDSVMVENSMIGKGTTRGGTGRTPRRRRP